jgi:hypothetical protein
MTFMQVDGFTKIHSHSRSDTKEIYFRKPVLLKTNRRLRISLLIDPFFVTQVFYQRRSPSPKLKLTKNTQTMDM